MDVHLDSSTPPPDPTQAPPLDHSPHLTSNAVSSPLQNNTEWEKPEEPVKTRSSKRLQGNFEVIFPDLRPALKIFHVMTILVFLKQLPHVDQIHPTLVPFLLNIYDPPADGNCGYHALAHGLQVGAPKGQQVINYLDVRKDLRAELSNHLPHYTSIFAGDLERINRAMDVPAPGPVKMDKWLVVPDMLVIASNAFGRPCVMISKEQPMTCLPTRVSPTQSSQRIPLLLCFINSNHFLAGVMAGKSEAIFPYPPVVSIYERLNKRPWSAWSSLIQQNLALWNSKEQTQGSKRRNLK